LLALEDGIVTGQVFLFQSDHLALMVAKVALSSLLSYSAFYKYL